MNPGVAVMWVSFWSVAVVLLFLEIVATGTIGRLLGFWNTVALLTGKSVLGLGLLVRQCPQALRDAFRIVFKRHQVPGLSLVETLLLLLAPLLIIFPGFLAGLLGAALLVPRWRRKVARLGRDMLLSWLSGRLLR